MFKTGQFNYKLSETGKQGDLTGGGITTGYQLRLNRALDLDFNLGLGYLTIVVEPTGDAAERITEIVVHLTGAAGHWTSLPIPTEPFRASCCPSQRLPKVPIPASGKPRCGCWV